MGKLRRRRDLGRQTGRAGRSPAVRGLCFEGLEHRRLLSAGRVTTLLSWQGQTVNAVRDAWVVRMPATNTRGTATPLDDVYASPSVPAGWSAKSLGYGFHQVAAPGVSLQNVSVWASANKARYFEPSVVRDKPSATFTPVRLSSPGGAAPLAGAPNDPSFNQQWALSNTGQNGGRAGSDISALSAWDVTTGSQAAVVAVLDSGVDYRHPDLAPNMWVRPASIPASVVGMHGYDTGDDDGDPMDDTPGAGGHGTHVAGIIGARGGNGIGISGINQTASILALKIGDSSGAITGDLAAMTKLVELKQTYGVNIVAANASYGYYGPPMQQDRDAISLLNSAGILLVAAAGNSNRNNDGGVHHYPSDYDLANIIGVASTGNNDSRAPYSSYGRTSIDVAAPGGAMSSATDPRGILSTLPNNAYGFQQGTSMAAPYVTGLAALLKAAKPTATAGEIRTAILNGVDKVAALTPFVATGGRINARRSMDLLLGNTTPAPTVTVADVSVTEGNAGTTTAQVSFTLSAAATGATTIAYRTAAGTATAGSDFIAATGTLSIPAGSTSGSVSVAIVGDTALEPDETFSVIASSVNGTPVTNVSGTVRIVNDDTAPTGPAVSVGSASINEGHFGTPVMRFTITLASAATRQTSVDYVTSNGTAIAGEDYFAARGTLAFRPGETTRTVDVRVVGDVRVESDETLTMTLSNPSGLTLGTATATGTIVNDDSNAPPAPPAAPNPPAAGGFQITLSYPDSSLTTSQRQVFAQAAARWSQIIVGDLPDVTVNGQLVDDIMMTAVGVQIDGAYGTLGTGGPSWRVGDPRPPSQGRMTFDTADLPRMERDGTLLSVVLHEMGHALGLGTMWQARSLVGSGGYTGAKGLGEYRTLFGLPGATAVPMDGSGHWSETVFRTELMTPIAERAGTPMPISRITIGSLQDLGYTVNYAAADAFARPAASPRAVGRASSPLTAAAGPGMLLVAPVPAVPPVAVAAAIGPGPRMASPAAGVARPATAAEPVVRVARLATISALATSAVGSSVKRGMSAGAGEPIASLAGRSSVFAMIGAGDGSVGS